MVGVREHVHSLYLFEFKSLCDEKFDISCHCDRITGNIEKFEIIVFFEIGEVANDIWMEAFTWRIDDYQSDILNF